MLYICCAQHACWQNTLLKHTSTSHTFVHAAGLDPDQLHSAPTRQLPGMARHAWCTGGLRDNALCATSCGGSTQDLPVCAVGQHIVTFDMSL